MPCEIRSWRRLSKKEKDRVLTTLNDDELALLAFDAAGWWSQARAAQIAPEGDWSYWLILAGRGWGKTRSGSEWVRQKVVELPASRGAFVAKDPGEARDVMIEGESGILAMSSPHDRPEYKSSLKQLIWPNGTIATIYSSEDYEELRGPQHHWAWADEPAKWRNVSDTWKQLRFGLRLGANPQVCLTTTPRPIQIIRDLLKDPRCVVTRGTTYENLANLSPMYRSIISEYEGTRLGRQELNAEVLDDVPGALWTYGLLDKYRLTALPPGVDLARVVCAIDPSATEDGAEAGIIIAGKGTDGRGYLLQDATMRGRPEAWAKRAVEALRSWNGDRIVAEVNNGGAMVEAVIKAYDRSVPYKELHASRGKITRAEPISTLYERGLISHVGSFPELEDQQCTYDPETAKVSPDRMDAAVWAFTELFGKSIVTAEQLSAATEANEAIAAERTADRGQSNSGFSVGTLRSSAGEMFQ